MKAKRRQELKTNELATALTQLREWHDRNSTMIWGVVLGIVVVLLVSTLWYRSSVNRQAEDWNRFYTLRQQLAAAMQGQSETDPQVTLRELSDLASNAGDAKIRNSASLTVASFAWNLAQAPGTADTTAMMSDAQASLKRVIDARKAADVTRLVAKLGQAAIRENAGEFDAAKAIYKEIAEDKSAEPTGLATLATTALERLDQPIVTRAFPPKPAPTTQPSPDLTTVPVTPIPVEMTDKGPDAVPVSEKAPADADNESNITSFVPTTQPAESGD